MNDSQLIDKLGGTQVVANICDLDKSAISKWRKRGIPKSWKLYLRRVRPSAFKK